MRRMRDILECMKRALSAVVVLSTLLCSACSAGQTAQVNDKILLANAGSVKIKDVVIATNKGDILWQGDLLGSQQKFINFKPMESGHFVVRYQDTSSTDKELHKGYFTLEGGLVHSFTFASDGSLQQETLRSSQSR